MWQKQIKKKATGVDTLEFFKKSDLSISNWWFIKPLLHPIIVLLCQ